MVLDSGGRPRQAAPSPINALKIGRLVHGCDPDGACAPFLVCMVHDIVTISGVVFARQMLSVTRVPHDPQPNVTLRIVVPNQPKHPTWHWPNECPWNR